MSFIVNSSKIEKIYTHNARQSNRFKYVEGESEKYTFFGLIKTRDEIKPHWSGWWGETYYTLEDLINEYSSEYFINKEVLFEYSVWEKPHIDIIMSKSSDITIYYDTHDELTEAVKFITESNPNLVVIKS
jgi:hypothetical protein